jgi:uncharacterized protein (TIGR02444 family)
MATSDQALWRFSLAFYARPGVAEALLALQDRAGCDVNIMLFALWLGAAHGRRLDAAELTAAESAIAPLRGIVARLRELRRQLKAAADADLQDLRRQVAQLELSAERRVLRWLAGLGAANGDTAERYATAAANLALYLGSEAQSEEAEALRAALAAFLQRA